MLFVSMYVWFLFTCFVILEYKIYTNRKKNKCVVFFDRAIALLPEVLFDLGLVLWGARQTFVLCPLVISALALGSFRDLSGILQEPFRPFGDLQGSVWDLSGTFRDLSGTFRVLSGPFMNLQGSVWDI